MSPVELMAPAMFIALVIFLLLGLPVAFSLAALGLSCGLIAIQFDFSRRSLWRTCHTAYLGLLVMSYYCRYHFLHSWVPY